MLLVTSIILIGDVKFRSVRCHLKRMYNTL